MEIAGGIWKTTSVSIRKQSSPTVSVPIVRRDFTQSYMKTVENGGPYRSRNQQAIVELALRPKRAN
jgi:hypothetical protein